MTALGRLEPIDFGTTWGDEAQNFTPWLAKEANLKILGEIIGSELELEGQGRRVGDQLYTSMPEAKPLFRLLHAEWAAIEQAIGAALDWQELLGLKASRISLSKDHVDPSDETDWPAQHQWLADKLELFDRVFWPRLKQLNAVNWTPEPEPGGEESPEVA